ncbi:putative thioredoxin binding protein [Fowlpox virus]|nr:putative thioredoxin binding protein [Fowlpox virus]
MVSGKIKNMTVILYYLNNENVYFAGDTVSGRLILEVVGEVRVNSIKIIATGYAKVRWSKANISPVIFSYANNYYKKVEYFNYKYVLIKDINTRIIYPGIHEYGFSFELPSTLPASSFESKYGSVRYYIKAELDRPLSLPMIVKKQLTVFENIDINTPSLVLHQYDSVKKTVHHWICKSGTISLSVNIGKKGYVPNEAIQIVAEIENYSSRTIIPIANLYQIQTFHARGKIKKVKQLIISSRGKQLLPRNIEVWNNKYLKIPQVSPSILCCDIIHLEYMLVVYVDIPGATNLSLNFPIIIGTTS